jgi:hypothetical protein
MSTQTGQGRYLFAITESGLLIVHSLPITLSWVPRDIVNDAYNVGGTLTVGTFESVDDAKSAAVERYQITAADWQESDRLPFQPDTPTENHTPEIDGHNFLRHGIHWK